VKLKIRMIYGCGVKDQYGLGQWRERCGCSRAANWK